MRERDWRSTGQTVQIDGPNYDRIPEFDPRAGAHLWSWTALFRTTPKLIDDPAATPMLDAENLLCIAGPGCFYCEQPYDRHLAQRRCKGKP